MYKTTVGIEVHCELKTNSKMFSTSINNYGGVANTNIDLIDFAYPGVLPQINMDALKLALKAALLLNCTINRNVTWDRKNYFYPDLPKGYQITQARYPIGINGYVDININDNVKRIRIHDIHIEEDTCKSTHGSNTSYLDYNRAGVPLIEIVSEADMNSSEEAMAYLEKLRELLIYGDISDCKMEEGSMRADVNVSVSENDTLGTRTETKNIGSIRNVGKAILRESLRQIEEINKGNKIVEETRRYDEKSDQTILMRVKETGNDYRYFPEPDLPEYNISDEFIKEVKDSITVTPYERRKIYKEAGIKDINIEKIIANKEISDYLLNLNCNLVIASNLLLGDIIAYLNKNNVKLLDTHLTYDKMNEVVNKLNDNTINNQIVKDILDDLLGTDKDINTLINSKKDSIIDDSELLDVINIIVSNNPDSIKDYKDGRDRAVKYLMGLIMKETKGKVNPSVANKMLIEILSSK